MISCRQEVADDVIFSENVKTIKGYTVLNFEVASSSSFPDIQKDHFVTVAEMRKRIRVSLKKSF